MAFAWKNAHFVAPCASAKLLLVSLGRALHEDFERFPHISLIAFQAQLALKRDYLVQPAGFHIGWHVVGIYLDHYPGIGELPAERSGTDSGGVPYSQ